MLLLLLPFKYPHKSKCYYESLKQCCMEPGSLELKDHGLLIKPLYSYISRNGRKQLEQSLDIGIIKCHIENQ